MATPHLRAHGEVERDTGEMHACMVVLHVWELMDGDAPPSMLDACMACDACMGCDGWRRPTKHAEVAAAEGVHGAHLGQDEREVSASSDRTWVGVKGSRSGQEVAGVCVTLCL